MHYRITAPVGHTGIVAGVSFANGTGHCCYPPMGAIEFLRRHGYTVVAVDPDPCDEGEVVVIEESVKPGRPRRGKPNDTTTTTTTTAEGG